MIMERNLAFEADPERFRQQWLEQEHELSAQIEQARKLVRQVKYSRRDLLSIAALSASLNVDGHRSDLVILKASRAHAAFEGRDEISERDIALAAELAYPHRIKRGPFEQADIAFDELQERIEQLQGASASLDDMEPSPDQQESDEKKKP
jgi:Mg-chelatase subunit ChlI